MTAQADAARWPHASLALPDQAPSSTKHPLKPDASPSTPPPCRHTPSAARLPRLVRSRHAAMAPLAQTAQAPADLCTQADRGGSGCRWRRAGLGSRGSRRGLERRRPRGPLRWLELCACRSASRGWRGRRIPVVGTPWLLAPGLEERAAMLDPWS
jgi:hypothetical protein